MNNLFRKNNLLKSNYSNSSDYFIKKYENYIFFKKPKYFDLSVFKNFKETLKTMKDKEDNSIENSSDSSSIEIFDEYVICSSDDNNRNIKILIFLSVSSFVFYFLTRKYIK